MTRRCLMAVFWMSAAAALAKPARPNVVWLVSEDNSARWLRLYDPNGAAMPRVEGLAAHGIVFNHAFSCGAVCSVARSTLISGCYATRTGSQYHRQRGRVPMPEGIHMFPYYLRRAGYYTSNCSKEDYNFEAGAKAGVWDDSSKKASYRNRAAGQPFFHVQNFGVTHEGGLHFKNMEQPTRTPTDAVSLPAYYPDTEIFRYTAARYHDNHAKLDAQLGAFVRGLERDGLLDDTFVFYYGDHGGVLPRSKGYAYNSGLQVPLVVYVPDNWKHLAPAAAGSRVDGFVEFVDFSATVLRLAGVEIPGGIDGEPFLGEGVEMDGLNRRDTAFGHADRFDEKYDLVRSMRKGRFFYVRNYQPFNFDGLHNEYRYEMLAYRAWRALYRAGGLNAARRRFFERRPPEMLFDLDRDPDEVNNLAGDPAFAEKLLEMRALLQRRVKSMPDLSFIPEPIFLRAGRDHPVRYGRDHQEEIERLVDIADLSLLPFAEAKPRIARALESPHALERYWGLIACSSFGTAAAPFHARAKEMAAADADRLVRVRAAEFLGLAGAADPRPVLRDALARVSDPTEALLILNSAVLLRDAEPGYDLDVSEFDSAAWRPKQDKLVRQRLNYLKQHGGR